MAQVRYRQNPRTAGRVINGRAFVITPDDNKLHTLNGTGSQVWTMANASFTTDEVVDALTQRFRVSAEVARADVEAFLDDVTARGILERVGDTGR